MEKSKLPRRFRAYLPLLGLFVLLLFLMPRSPKFTYDYRKGSPWMYETLVAQFDFPLLKTDAQYQAEREKAGLGITPFYRHDASVGRAKINELAAEDMGAYASLKPSVTSVLESLYSKGILPEDGTVPEMDNAVIYIQKNMRANKMPVSEVYSVSTATAALADALSGTEVKPDSELYARLMSLVVPDMEYDQQTTDLIHDENINHVSRTQGIIKGGHTIVSRGEIVTAEVEQMLDSYKAEYDQSVGYNGAPAVQWIGNAMIALLFVIILFFAIYYCNYTIFDRFNEYLYILLVFTLASLGAFLVAKFIPGLFYLVPFPLIALYMLAFFSKRLVFIVYILSLLPLLVAAPDGVELFFVYLTAGVVGIYVFDYFNKGWLQFVTALIIFVVMVLVWTAFRLVDGVEGVADYRVIWNMALGAFMTVAGYPLIYLFEKMFRLVSTSKLVELSDTSNTLLRLLADKAPGTFQHSLQVMNLSDAVARAIDANVPLVRAGALYHDIGKISNPQCFTENETPGVKYHEGLTAKESAQEIIRHVSDGLALAEKYNLPGVLKAFISSHHGTTCAAYFLNKYLNEGGDPSEVSEFYYNGVNPVTKEQVILMFCDAVEAASRSLKDYSAESISDLVERIINGKADDGQLSDSDISLREVTKIKEVLKSYLQQMYHSRVVYPKRNARVRK
ncbi:MAG: HDIG domain-containing protein [Bacteroidales bacterium]|nr:HDIG domain-containing protein [Bacteroidales bacterium]